ENRDSIRDAKFPGRVKVVAEIPAPHSDILSHGIIKLDRVHVAGIRVGKDFVDEDGRQISRRRIALARGASGTRGWPPVLFLAPSVPRLALVHDLEGEAKAIRDRVPIVVVTEIEDFLPSVVLQPDILAPIVQ